MIDIKKIQKTLKSTRWGGWIFWGILLYFFNNVMINTLYISGFIVVYVIYLHLVSIMI